MATVVTRHRTTSAPSVATRAVPWLLALGMAALIGLSIVGISSGTPDALPAPSQYTTPPSPPFTLGGAGEIILGVLAVLVFLALALMFVVWVRRRRRSERLLDEVVNPPSGRGPGPNGPYEPPPGSPPSLP
ncbi:MAG: hypothetical protein KGJ23_10260 [Euryarchaeota archaeon]|nr:hypothetical protein [Euryarchaeota archaeon]MDE1836988.1 hypothetical protein [Euryarchaeota archaeon]MDE1881569.1 hypothetical protein [Euryarchaeota archaeon]MDE2046364.1 hypothetical protein [Thermoplasmata archaeon]